MSKKTYCAFGNPDVFIVRNDSLHIAAVPLSHEVSIQQADDGPSFVVVGRDCTDQYLKGVWERRKRFPDLKLSDLMAVRDGSIVEIQMHQVAPGSAVN